MALVVQGHPRNCCLGLLFFLVACFTSSRSQSPTWIFQRDGLLQKGEAQDTRLNKYDQNQESQVKNGRGITRSKSLFQLARHRSRVLSEDFEKSGRKQIKRSGDKLIFPPRRTDEEATVRADEAAVDYLGGSRAIVVFSDREVACSDQFWEELRDYANRVNATLHHVRDLHGPEVQQLRRKCALTNETIRFAKYAMMPFFLQRYAEVALFDDSIMVSKFAPDIFNLGAGTRAVKGTYDASPILQEHCDTYGVPHDRCALERRFVNSGLLVFSREHHMHLFDEPCERWKLSGAFYDEALFNAVFMKQRTPIYDLNGESASAEPHWCSTRMPLAIPSRSDINAGRCGAFQEWVGNASSCFLLIGTQMAILSKSGYLAKAAESACFAHVTRGSLSERDPLRCDISRLLLCKSQVHKSDLTLRLAVALMESPRMSAPLPQQGGAAFEQHSDLSEIVNNADWASCSRTLTDGGQTS